MKKKASIPVMIHNINFQKIYFFMERPVFFIIALVCAIPLSPPNAVKLIARTYLLSSGRVVVLKKCIPFVSSVIPIQIVLANSDIGVRRKQDAKMEKIIIYPPILVNVSKPFIIPASTI